ncbi:MAG: DNA polymerase III subunit gamma/tau [Hirschia sp.]|nr:DNA polymerase III subunit gamma/tau [Hirschia sp.]MBF17319.1 DNA polymerase III subunit gamma/tau [Hirschia sp.]
MTDSSDTLPDEGLDPNTGSMFSDNAPATNGAYQVLARKYRPSRFEDMVGQEAMVRTLTNAFKTGRIVHAFMLTGVRGVGKTTTARLLARALNYQSDDHDGPSIKLDPPGRHCQAIMESRHPDILELDAASRTGVADMRELLDGVRYAPVDARYKVYIIDEVHMLSTAAFNALLKTLEEPPEHVKFIFATTEIRKVPVTVLSRCQRFNLQRLTADALASHLGNICKTEGAKVAADGLALIARAAEGSARDALSILDQAIVQAEADEVTAEDIRDMLGLADRTRIFDLLDAALEGRHKDALKETTAQLQAGAEAQVLIKDLLDAVAELARAQALGDEYSFAGPADWAERTKSLAGKASPAQASRYWKVLLQGFEDCARAPDPSVAAEMVVLRLAAAASLPSPEEAARILAGGGDGPAPGGSGGGQPSKPPAQGNGPSTGSNGGGGSGTRASRGGGAAVAMLQPAPEDAPGPVLRSLGEICAAMQTDKQVNLLFDVEHYTRPAEIAYGRFTYTPLPELSADFPMRMKNWLEETTGVEWKVDEAHSDKKTLAELREDEEVARIAEIKTIPEVAEALAAFPQARIVKVERLDDDGQGGVIRVDFSRRRNYDAYDASDEDDLGPVDEVFDPAAYENVDCDDAPVDDPWGADDWDQED